METPGSPPVPHGAGGSLPGARRPPAPPAARRGPASPPPPRGRPGSGARLGGWSSATSARVAPRRRRPARPAAGLRGQRKRPAQLTKTPPSVRAHAELNHCLDKNHTAQAWCKEGGGGGGGRAKHDQLVGRHSNRPHQEHVTGARRAQPATTGWSPWPPCSGTLRAGSRRRAGTPAAPAATRAPARVAAATSAVPLYCPCSRWRPLPRSLPAPAPRCRSPPCGTPCSAWSPAPRSGTPAPPVHGPAVAPPPLLRGISISTGIAPASHNM
eukprot:COSAG01_NODE_2563_length_7449_cov_10.912517_2_plen_269_part_00